MAWTAWRQLARRKDEGGLGFRDIQAFNDALLAKLSWRILGNPQCLLARILIGKYCHTKTFLNCGNPNSASHGWRSILIGKELLEKNIGWAIGDGERVNAWEDNWLSTTHQEAPIGPTTEQQRTLKVAALIDKNLKTWDQQKIRELMPCFEGKILNIKLSSTGAKDKWIWLKHYSGEYSVKSGYHEEMNEKNGGRTREQTINWDWNQDIWSLKTYPKIKLFMWKAATETLPTRERLHSRKIIENPACSKCGEPETISHLLFSCHYAKQVWDYIPVARRQNSEPSSEFKTTWRVIREQICLPPAGVSIPIAPWVCWNIWKARNNRDFNNRIFTVEETAIKSIKEAREWNLAQEKEKKPPDRVRTQHMQRIAGRVICRSDAAWKKETGIAGFGWICSGEQDRYTFKQMGSCRWVNSALMAESLALREAMISVKEKGVKHILFESDSKQLIQAINMQARISEIHGVLFDILSLKSGFESIGFALIKREMNEEADKLAKIALNVCTENTLLY